MSAWQGGAAPAPARARVAWCDRLARLENSLPPPRRRETPRSSSWRLLHGQLRFALRHDRQHHAVRVAQVTPRCALDVGGSHMAVAIEILLEIVGDADVVVVEVQPIRLAAEASH